MRGGGVWLIGSLTAENRGRSIFGNNVCINFKMMKKSAPFINWLVNLLAQDLAIIATEHHIQL